MAGITAIKTNLERISKAKTDIISAITAKGGTVASGAKIEDLPACIRAIPTGGSGGETAYIKVGGQLSSTTVIILPGKTIGAATLTGDPIECKVGDLVGVVTNRIYKVGVEFGCELTYQTYAGTGTAGKTIAFVTITDADAAFNVVS